MALVDHTHILPLVSACNWSMNHRETFVVGNKSWENGFEWLMTSVTNAVNLEGMLILEGSIEDRELGCFRVGKVSVNMASAMGAE